MTRGTKPDLEAPTPSQSDALAELAALAEIARAPKRAPVSPRPVDALAQLAALAEITRAPKPKPKQEAGDAEDVERLAHLLGFVLPVEGHGPAAAAVRRFGSFAAVLAAPEAELRRVPGLGTHSIAAIKLVHAAAVRLARAGVAAAPVLDDKKRLADYLAAALQRERIEQFRILFLDEHGMLKADEVQASGTVNHTPVYPREVVRRALALGAASLVLVHNHPSGDPEPSREDLEMTRHVQQAAAVMSIAVRDHVIVGNGRWLSFRDEGLLE
jgi:DNA repair protein RadC